MPGEDAPRLVSTAGGDVAPPASVDRDWWVAPLDTSRPRLSAVALDALAGWMREHAVPGVDLSEVSALDTAMVTLLGTVQSLERVELRIDRHAMVEALDALAPLHRLRFLRLNDAIPLNGVTAQRLERFADLADLEISFDDDSHGMLTGMRRLRSLQVQGAGMLSADDLGILPALERLDVQMPIAPDAWPEMAGLERLQGLAYLSRQPLAIAVDLPRVTAYDGRIPVEGLQRLPGLRHLDLSGATTVHAAALRGLRLVSLKLSYPEADTTFAPVIRSLDTLERLAIPAGSGSPEIEAAASLPALRSLTVPETERFPAKGAELIGRRSTIEELSIAAPKRLDDVGVGHLADLQRLRRLSLSGCKRVTDAALSAFARMTALEELDLWNTGLTEDGLVAFPHLPSLRRFRSSLRGLPVACVLQPGFEGSGHHWKIPEADFTPANAALLARSEWPPMVTLPSTASSEALTAFTAVANRCPGLVLSGSSAVHDCLASSARARTIEAQNLSPASLASLKNSPWLSCLRLDQEEHSDELACALRGAVSLRELALRGSAVTDAVIAAVSELPALVELTLDGCPVSDMGAGALGLCQSVRRLWLRRCPAIGDQTLSALAGATRLDNLFIEDAVLTGSGFASWRETHLIRELHLDQTPQLSVVAIEHLARLRSLHDLNLTRTGISDAIWPYLVAMPGLRSVLLHGNELLTFEALQAVQPALDAREIRIYHDIPKRVKPSEVVSRRLERARRKQWSGNKPFVAEHPGRLNAAVVRELKRLGGVPGDAPDGAAALSAPVRELVSYRFPQGVTFASDEDSDAWVWSLEFGLDEVNDFAQLLCLQGRRFDAIAYADGGNYLIMVPRDTDMVEDPPVYRVDHEWYGNEDAENLDPMPLSEFLALLKPEEPDEEPAEDD